MTLSSSCLIIGPNAYETTFISMLYKFKVKGEKRKKKKTLYIKPESNHITNPSLSLMSYKYKYKY